MHHRERVVTALAHQQPDAVPIDIGATPVTGITHGGRSKVRSAGSSALVSPRVFSSHSLSSVTLSVISESTITAILRKEEL